MTLRPQPGKTSMISERAFLLTVLEQPEETAPRLVYADWLEEQGETTRAEFIRLQCAGENEPRQRELLNYYGAAWAAGPVVRHAYHFQFRRGFVEEVTIQARLLLDLGAELFLHSPIRLLRLIGAHGLIGRLVQLPELRRLRALHLTGCAIGDEGVELLAKASVLTGLQTLRLGANAVTDYGVEALVDSGNFQQLQALVLRDNLIGDPGAQLLARAKSWPRLQCLDLSDNLIGDDGLQSLARAPSLHMIPWLDQSHQFKGHSPGPHLRERVQFETSATASARS
jgi:uncharacterized protein (TIGR02996 family)